MSAGGVAALRRWEAAAAELHDLPAGEPAGVEVWVLDVVRPAVVLGSRQSSAVLDVDACRRDGVDIVTRRSGGGVVLLEPGAVVWIDLVVAAGSPWWCDDVVTSMIRCGEVFRQALGDPSLRVHRGRLQRDPLADLVCFAGVGPGEVLHGDAKLVGLSARRRRQVARYQALIHHRWNPERLAGLLAPGLAPPEDLAAIDVATNDIPAVRLATRVAQAMSGTSPPRE